MKDKLYDVVGDAFVEDVNFVQDGDKITLVLGENGKHGFMETYAIFSGIILSFIDIKLNNSSDVFIENEINNKRLLEINHCSAGRYAYQIGDDKLIYFGKGDLCISIYDLTKSVSDFPVGYYKGLEFFIDVDEANDKIKEVIPDFDLIDFYENLQKNGGYVLVRANEKIDHVIGELYDVDERIRMSYFKIKTIELLLFFSITHFKKSESHSLSIEQAKIIDHVYNDLIRNLDKSITIDDLASKYSISKTTLKNCFKEVYGKPIFKWRKEYRLDYSCKLIQSGEYTISEISKMVGYSSPSKFSQAFKDYIGCNPSEYE